MTAVKSEQRITISVPVANLEQIADLEVAVEEFVSIRQTNTGLGQRHIIGLVKLGDRSPIRWGLDLAFAVVKATGYVPTIGVLLEEAA